MSAITLSVLVKNELSAIKNFAGKTFSLFDEIEVTDTGSTDGTVALLRSAYAVHPSFFRVSDKNHSSVLDARNFSLGLAKTDYVFVLDADEIVSEADVRKMREAIAHNPDADGFFTEWNTYKRGTPPIKDYKLNLFKNDPAIRFQGERHPYVTVSIRDKGGYAEWCDAVVGHFPDPEKEYHKLKRILSHLYELVAREPDFYRFHWFLGMTLHSLGNMRKAIAYLEQAAHSKSLLFPVECLNSHLLLADALYDNNEKNRALDVVESALGFYREVKDDFEVKANFRMSHTLEQMKEDIMGGAKRLQVYPFGGV